MNIVIDIRALLTSPRTGVGEYVFELLSAILARDKNNHYFLFYNSGKRKLTVPEWSAPNVTFVRARWPNKIINLAIALFRRPRLDKIIAKKIKKRPDIFFSPHINFTALSPDIKFILTVHDLTFELYPRFFSRRQRVWHRLTRPAEQIRRACLIFTPSDHTRRDIIKNINVNPKKIKRVYPGLGKHFFTGHAPETIRTKYGLDKKYLLFLGTIEPRKNVTALIRAFAAVADELPHNLIIAGAAGYRARRVKKFAARLSCARRIKFIGYVPDEDKLGLYRGAAIFIYPSFYEGFGFPVWEAINAGTPVITTARGSLPEIGGQDVFYANPQKPEDISRLIKQISRQTASVSSPAPTDGTEKFSWPRAAAEIIEIFTRMAEKK